MFRIKLVVVSQIFILISLFLTWICISNLILNKSINHSLFTFNYFITILFAVCIYSLLTSLRKIGTSKVKRVGVIMGFLLLFMSFIYLSNALYLPTINRYLIINTNLDDFNFSMFTIINLLLIFQIISTILLITLDCIFLFCYFKTISSYSKNIINMYIKDYNSLTRIKEIKSVYSYSFASIVLISLCIIGLFDTIFIGSKNSSDEAIMFFNNTKYLVDIILVGIIFIVTLVLEMFTSKNRIFYRINEKHNCFNLLFYLQLTSFLLIILFAILYYKFNYSFIALLLIVSPLVYIVPAIILLEKMNCYYINKINNIKKKEFQI